MKIVITPINYLRNIEMHNYCINISIKLLSYKYRRVYMTMCMTTHIYTIIQGVKLKYAELNILGM